MDEEQHRERKPAQLENSVDRISSLPDELLFHILSSGIPTKSVVQTKILSKRWRHLCFWPSITNLDFDFELETEESRLLGFRVFMNSVLEHFKQIDRFRLICPKRTQPDLTVDVEWIRKAVALGLVELEIQLTRLDIPMELFSCKTLESLKFDRTEYFLPLGCFPMSLPNLKILHLGSVDGPEESFQRLICSCPMLEDLSVGEAFLDLKEHVLDFTLPSLKRLILGPFADCDKIRIIINTPNLEYLDVHDEERYHFDCECLHSLVEASVDLRNLFPEDLQIREENRLIRRISGIKSLALYCSYCVSDTIYPWPTFHKLTSLGMSFSCLGAWAVLPNLLKSLPYLELLSLNNRNWRRNYCKCANGPPVAEPNSFSGFLLLHLEEIKVDLFKGFSYEVQVLEDLLEHAKVLKSLEITCEGLAVTEELDLFVKLSKKTRNCKIEFHGKYVQSLLWLVSEN